MRIAVLSANSIIPYLASGGLADKASGLLLCNSMCVETKALNVRVSRRTVVAIVALDLANLHHLCGSFAVPGYRIVDT